MRTLQFSLLCLCFTLLPQVGAATPVCDTSNVCVDGATWWSQQTLGEKERAKEKKRNAKGKNATLTVELESGRGSVFLDGVWLAPAPLSYVPIKPGKHDIEVRDGDQVRAKGVLTVPKSGGDIALRIRG